MKISKDFTGKTEDEAILQALNALGLERDEVSIEIVSRAKSGFLGIGAAPAVIRVTYDAPEQAPVQTIATPPEAQTAQAEVVRDRAEEFLQGLLQHMGVAAEITMTESESGAIEVSLSGENMGLIIGRRGETLDAIQHLTNYAANRGMDQRTYINVDAENYRSKREESLIRLAHKMAGKVLRYSRSMALEPMNSYERHVIHTALQEYEGVVTSSTGSEPNRRVVISCVGAGARRGGQRK